MAETMQVTGERLVEIRNAFNRLKDKKNEFSVDLRVAVWMKAIQPAFDVYRDMLAKIEHDELRASALTEPKERVEAIVAVSERRLALQRAPFDLPKPKRPLTPEELPKEAKGADDNERGRAELMALLAPEYCTLPDDE